MEPALVAAGGRTPQQRALRIGRSLHHRSQPGRQRTPSLPGHHAGRRRQLRGQPAMAAARGHRPWLRDPTFNELGYRADGQAGWHWIWQQRAAATLRSAASGVPSRAPSLISACSAQIPTMSWQLRAVAQDVARIGTSAEPAARARSCSIASRWASSWNCSWPGPGCRPRCDRRIGPPTTWSPPAAACLAFRANRASRGCNGAPVHGSGRWRRRPAATPWSTTWPPNVHRVTHC